MLSHCPVCGCTTLKPALTENSLYVISQSECPEEKPFWQVGAYRCEANGHIVMLAAGILAGTAEGPVETTNEILNSWKEIAAYTGRGVRTVQRWEEHFGLPVHRPKGKDRSAVFAFREEVNAWLRQTDVRARSVPRKTA